VFFFQAEDGIRDFHVTGVQTCALPISAEYWLPCPRQCLNCRLPADWASAMARAKVPARCRHSWGRSLLFPGRYQPATHARFSPRSEERRVGNECLLRGCVEESPKRSER